MGVRRMGIRSSQTQTQTDGCQIRRIQVDVAAGANWLDAAPLAGI